MLDVRKLRLLRELALRGTLAEVAAALNFSPSAVSQQLSALEKEAGVALLSPQRPLPRTSACASTIMWSSISRCLRASSIR